MNVGEQLETRYPMIADLFKQKMNIKNEDSKGLSRRIQREYVNKFFGKISRYSGYYWRAPRIVRYFIKMRILSALHGSPYTIGQKSNQFIQAGLGSKVDGFRSSHGSL